MIEVYFIETEVAGMALGAKDGGLCFSLWRVGEWRKMVEAKARGEEIVEREGMDGASECVVRAERLVREYMSGLQSEEARKIWAIEVAELTKTPLFGTEFQRRVWSECAKVEFGERETYGGLARRIGMKGASRAVGGALHINPFELLVPCHRIVRGDGGIGEYATGRWMKEWLLRFEGRFVERCKL